MKTYNFCGDIEFFWMFIAERHVMERNVGLFNAGQFSDNEKRQK